MSGEGKLRTAHRIIIGDSRRMEEVGDRTIHLVVTSPPYPMIEMWDELFSSLNPEIEGALLNEDGALAYSLMNKELDKVWKEVDRVLTTGGIVCINVGDATRKIGGAFQLYPNHSSIIHRFEEMNYQVLPPIIWRKQTNKPNKYMGSGMLPSNAYVTLEHEYILIFRKGGNRSFDPEERENRRKSAYFWEERNVWFSDIWTDLKGISQEMGNDDLRERSAAYPFELAYRLISMYSIQGDTVLDPFLGTGTTIQAAVHTGRNSIGYELYAGFMKVIEDRIAEFRDVSRELAADRLERHAQFVEKRQAEKGNMKHRSLKYGFPVMTGQEKNILFPVVKRIERIEEGEFEVEYSHEVK